MIGRKALAQRATVELVDRLVSHVRQADVAGLIGLTGPLKPGTRRLGICVDRYLDLVNNGAKIGVETRIEYIPEMLELNSLLHGRLAETDPDNVALTNVLHAGRAVDKVVDLTLQDGLKVLLHGTPCDLDDNAEVHRARLLNLVKGRAYHRDLAVLHLVEIARRQVFEGTGVTTAELDAHVGSSHSLTLKRAAVGHRNRDFGDRHLDAAHVHTTLHEPASLLGVVLSLDVIERHANNMFVLRHARWQDLRDHGICDGGKAVRDRSCRRGILQVVDLPQGKGKGEHPVLVIEEDVADLAPLHPPKG